MGTHTKSNKEARKRKYAEQFAKTNANKKRKEQKRQMKLLKAKERKNGKQ